MCKNQFGNCLHTSRKGVYTLANEEATEKDSYAC